MTVEYNVLAPGPVNLHPKVREALALPMIHHRTPEFDRILARVLTQLKSVFQTQQPVFVLSSTGSGGMEALLINCMHPGDTVLAIDSGKFGERWCEMVETFGGKLLRHKIQWGEAVAVSDIEQHLQNHPEIRIVLCQACETSSGVLHPIEQIGKLIQKYPNTLFLVDGITALGAVPLPMDQWHIDGLVGGSQKAFMLPTGLSLFSFSEKAWKRINNNPTPRFYFDVRKEKKANEKGETFFSSNVSLIRALDVVLELMLKNGLSAFLSEIDLRAQFTRTFACKMGFTLFAKAPSASLTALCLPAGLDVDSTVLRQELEDQFKITIMGGQDQAKGKIIRIGHMGYITPVQMIELMMHLGELVNKHNSQMCTSKQMSTLQTEMKSFLGLK